MLKSVSENDTVESPFLQHFEIFSFLFARRTWKDVPTTMFWVFFLIQLEWARRNTFYYCDLVTMNQAARRNYVFVIKN